MQPGEVFADRYLVLERLGEGGMGVVHRAQDRRLGRHVALKVMKGSLNDDPAFRTRFEREAASAVGFEHPNVVPVYDYAEHDGALYLVMRLVDGRDLSSELRAVGRLDLRRTVRLVQQIAAGLGAGHRRGHVHRDVKPANILLGQGADGREQALLTDFGLAQPQRGGQGLTSTGLLLGTVAYMAPEQLRGERASVASDVYALACVTYECLTGRPPFRGATDVQTAQGHLSEPVPDLRALAPDVPPQVAAVVEQGLAKDPAARPASVDEFAERLAAAVDSGDVTAAVPWSEPSGSDQTRVLELPPLPPPRPTPTRSGRRRSRSRRGLPAAAALLVLALAGGAATVYLTDPSRRPTGTTGTSTPTPDDPHEALQERLPAAVYTDCRPDPEREGEGREVSLKCGSPLPGVDELLVTQWSDASAMAANFAQAHGDRPDGKCGQYAAEPPTGLRSTWGDDAPLACFVNSQSDAILLWEYPDRALQVVAVRGDAGDPGLADDARALFRWWTTAVRSDPT